MSLRRLLLPLLLLCLSLPASANLFDQRPAASPLGAPLNNSSDFLPVREAFKLSLVSSDTQTVTLRFVAAEGYYLYRHRFNFSVEPADLALGEAELPAGQAKHDELVSTAQARHDELLAVANLPGLDGSQHGAWQLHWQPPTSAQGLS